MYDCYTFKCYLDVETNEPTIAVFVKENGKMSCLDEFPLSETRRLINWSVL